MVRSFGQLTVAVLVLVELGCGHTEHRAPPSDSGVVGSAGGRSSGAAATGDASGGPGTSAGQGGDDGTLILVVDERPNPALACDAPWSGLQTCSTSTACYEAVGAEGAAAVEDLCRGEGTSPLTEQCTVQDFRGRCIVESNDYWTYYYDGDGSDPLGECRDAGGKYCSNPSGLPPADIEACRAACLAARPDLSASEECESVVDCNLACQRVLRNRTHACGRCLLATLAWPESECSGSSCDCEWPTFAATDDFVCEVQCAEGAREYCAVPGGGECEGHAVDFPYLAERDGDCTWEIPPPADGEAYDPDHFNVGVSLDCETSDALPLVDGEAECGERQAWYWSSVDFGLFALCPATCQRLKDEGRGSIGTMQGCPQYVF